MMEQTDNVKLIQLINKHTSEWISCAESIRKSVWQTAVDIFGDDLSDTPVVSIGWDSDKISIDGLYISVTLPSSTGISCRDLQKFTRAIGVSKWLILGKALYVLELKMYAMGVLTPAESEKEESISSATEADSHISHSDNENGVADAEVVALYESGMSINKIAQQIGRSGTYVKLRIKRAGVKRRGKRNLSTLTERKIVQQYKAGASLEQLKKDHHVGDKRLRTILTYYGVVLRNSSEVTEDRYKHIVTLYKAGATNNQIMGEIGLKSDYAIYEALKRAGIKPNHKAMKERENNENE